ncbi:hypothetical protein [Shouchella clausii]|uniref:hypothetical protein n=1 Tax=Shouchella clausii TaxID=79880 RepID=UPI001C7344EC|nr:hypothetical protein [Shouchella clausii]MBX0320318.1 hypothetical protein [Shouchella clausii]MEB5480919.1 hypothetical protein [Shouchella clausii]
MLTSRAVVKNAVKHKTIAPYNGQWGRVVESSHPFYTLMFNDGEKRVVHYSLLEFVSELNKHGIEILPEERISYNEENAVIQMVDWLNKKVEIKFEDGSYSVVDIDQLERAKDVKPGRYLP